MSGKSRWQGLPIVEDEVVIKPDAIKVSDLRSIVGDVAGNVVYGAIYKFEIDAELKKLWVVSTPAHNVFSYTSEEPAEPYRAFLFHRPSTWTPERLRDILTASVGFADYLDALVKSNLAQSLATPQDQPSRTVGESHAERLLIWTAQQLGRQVISDDDEPRPFIVVSDFRIELMKTLAHKGAKPQPNKAPESSIPKAPKRNRPIVTVAAAELAEDAVTDIEPSSDRTDHNGLHPALAGLARTGLDLDVLEQVTPPVDLETGR